jgi:uncharacterized DUF497 family protein
LTIRGEDSRLGKFPTKAVFSPQSTVFSEKSRMRHRLDEDLYAALGRTAGGRYIIVYFIYKKDGRAIIVTAHEMSKRERKKHEKK